MKILLLLIAPLLSLQVMAKSPSDTQTFEREEVRQVIRKNLKSFLACYNDGKKKNPDIEGKVILEWEIATDGTVKTASVKSTTLKDEAVENCIVNQVKALKFPSPPEGTTATVSYPLVFAKKQ